ncbi:CHAT domain-containing protein [Leptolyngbya ohadii]|uniref:CHAT domain-containing protein n=1 Tax=Leptolyngbya ohadii TaxID=1962290 RepID=UPI000B59C143|nr:CHAT domain-containing protein [Leptolyngbya ohadii]
MTQEFHLSVTPVGNDEYLVRTERVAPGVPLAEEQLVLPLESWLAQARQLMSDPLLGILQGDRSFTPDPANPSVLQPSLSLVELGQQLYHHLFQGTLRDSWLMAQGVAQNRRQALRLRLGLKGDRLPRLPWEVLYGCDTPIERMRQGQAARPLATGIQVIFSRYRPATRLAEEGVALAIEPGQPLKILMVVASPSDREQLQLYREATQLQQELRLASGGANESDIQLTILSQPGREELTQALEQGQYQVLHYAGHSDSSSGGGSLYLVNNRTGLTELMSGQDLAGLLVNNGIRLAVFNSCRGAYTPTYITATTATATAAEGTGHNLAEALVNRGIPAVLAMAEEIPDEVALNLTRLFYRNLKQGYPIDLSLSRARQGLISSYGSDQLYWALPILYLHPEFDGYLISPDRSQEDPADRLLFTPPTYEVMPLPPGEEAIFPPALLVDAEAIDSSYAEDLIDTEEADLIAQAVLADDADWLDALEEAGATEDDDFAVADMIRELIPPASSDPTPPPAVTLPPVDLNPVSTPRSSDPASSEQNRPPATAAASSRTADSNPSRPPANEERSIPSNRPASPSPAAEVALPNRGNSSQRARQRQQKAILLPLLGAVGAIGVGLLGYFAVPRLASWFDVSGSQTATQTPASPQAELAAKSTGDLQKLAIDSFSQNRFNRGQQAVEALLNRGAFTEAEAAIAAIPADRRNDATTHFLQGRLAWQAAKQGNSQYTIANARQSWQRAIAADPDNPKYYEAIGFADYQAGKPDQAIQSWVRALSLQEQPKAQEASNPPAMNDSVLTSYAGIALALWKTSTNPNASQPGELLSKAVKTYQMVEAMDATNFQPDALNQNWLWTPKAVQDWQSLAGATPEANGG